MRSPVRSISTATYAVPASWNDAEMDEMMERRGTGRSGMLTSVHVFPPSRVRWIRPFVVPTQITPRPMLDAASDSIDPRPPGVVAAAAESRLLGIASSGLSRVQCAPPSTVETT